MAGRWGGRRLRALPGRSVRPTSDRVREAWMSALGGTLDGLRVLDLFAGSGALGLEALSRGAREVVFVERDRKAARVIRENIRSLGVEPAPSLVLADAFVYLRKGEPSDFDVALADPPYRSGDAARLLTLFAERPFAHTLWVEHATAESVPALPGISQRRYGDTTLSTLTADS